MNKPAWDDKKPYKLVCCDEGHLPGQSKWAVYSADNQLLRIFETRQEAEAFVGEQPPHFDGYLILPSA